MLNTSEIDSKTMGLSWNSELDIQSVILTCFLLVQSMEEALGSWGGFGLGQGEVLGPTVPRLPRARRTVTFM